MRAGVAATLTFNATGAGRVVADRPAELRLALTDDLARLHRVPKAAVAVLSTTAASTESPPRPTSPETLKVAYSIDVVGAAEAAGIGDALTLDDIAGDLASVRAGNRRENVSFVETRKLFVSAGDPTVTASSRLALVDTSSAVAMVASSSSASSGSGGVGVSGSAPSASCGTWCYVGIGVGSLALCLVLVFAVLAVRRRREANSGARRVPSSRFLQQSALGVAGHIEDDDLLAWGGTRPGEGGRGRQANNDGAVVVLPVATSRARLHSSYRLGDHHASESTPRDLGIQPPRSPHDYTAYCDATVASDGASSSGADHDDDGDAGAEGAIEGGVHHGQQRRVTPPARSVDITHSYLPTAMPVPQAMLGRGRFVSVVQDEHAISAPGPASPTPPQRSGSRSRQPTLALMAAGAVTAPSPVPPPSRPRGLTFQPVDNGFASSLPLFDLDDAEAEAQAISNATWTAASASSVVADPPPSPVVRQKSYLIPPVATEVAATSANDPRFLPETSDESSAAPPPLPHLASSVSPIKRMQSFLTGTRLAPQPSGAAWGSSPVASSRTTTARTTGPSTTTMGSGGGMALPLRMESFLQRDAFRPPLSRRSDGIPPIQPAADSSPPLVIPLEEL